MTVIDPHLQWLYEDTPAQERAATRVSVMFEWHGDLEALTSFGMRLFVTTGGIISADMPLSKLPDVHALGLESIDLSRQAYPSLDVSRPDIGADKLQPVIGAETGKGVIIGIVDTGIDYTHASFCKPDGTTRLLYLWDQRLTLVKSRPGGKPRYPMEALPANMTDPYQTGVEFTEQAINAALTSGKPLRTRDTLLAHGSHVMGIAAGNGVATAGKPPTSFVGVAPAADLIVVATDFKFASIRLGFEYILERAKQLGRPCVVNLSLGMPLGARDGMGKEEKGIDAVLTTSGRAIVIAAGNNADKKRHVQGKIAQGAQDTLTFSVDTKQTGDAITVQIWYGLKSTAERFDVEVRDPTGALPDAQKRLGNAVVNIQPQINLPQHAKNLITIAIKRDNRVRRISPGIWSIKLSGKVVGSGAQAGAYHAYLDAPGKTGVPPTAFSSSQVSQASTVCIPATATKAISVGSYITKPSASTHKLSDFSSQGPALDDRSLPTLCAPGQLITSVRAVNAQQGPKGASFFAMQGTSMATPHVAGVVAGMLQVDSTLDQDDIVAMLGAQADAPPSPASNMWGKGRLNALKSITAAKPSTGS